MNFRIPAAVLLASAIAMPAHARTVQNVASVGNAPCKVITTTNQGSFSLPTDSSAMNTRDAFTWSGDFGLLLSAAISYLTLNATNPSAVTHPVWDSGSPDPYCFNYPLILNLRLS